jgi:hypothetical protein
VQFGSNDQFKIARQVEQNVYGTFVIFDISNNIDVRCELQSTIQSIHLKTRFQNIPIEKSPKWTEY